ncbi:hypothetical protein R4P70_31500 [Rhodococcus sp. IEGM 1241]|nr:MULTISPECIES: hypothetical protein [Rhodococcus]MDV8015848.1 hypothetical protein [Rhodococcus sp. IEGM 1241]
MFQTPGEFRNPQALFIKICAHRNNNCIHGAILKPSGLCQCHQLLDELFPDDTMVALGEQFLETVDDHDDSPIWSRHQRSIQRTEGVCARTQLYR